nr:serine/arginine repetitive matrix protein 5-like isoform X2 [Misgurnus anguillicaudatus]
MFNMCYADIHFQSWCPGNNGRAFNTGEGPTLNSVGVSPRTKKKRVKLAEDGGSDLSSPEKTRQSCHEADGSDVDDDCSGANLKKNPTPNKNRRRRQTKSGETKYEGFDLLSPEKTRQPCREADGSDVDDDCSGANLKKNPTPNKKRRRRQTKSGETKYEGFDLSSPEKRLKSCHEADGSDVDDDCSGANLKKNPTPNKKRPRQTKSGETKYGGSDLSSPEKRLKSCHEADGSDVDDDCSGANLKKTPTPNKKRPRQTKSGETKYEGFDLLSPEKTRQPCREADGSDVDDDCSGANLKKNPTPNKKRRRRQTKSGETKYEGFDLSSPEKTRQPCREADGLDVDDDCSGANLKKNPTPNKNRRQRRQTKSGEAKDGGADLSFLEKRLKSCREDGSSESDVDDECSGANLLKKNTPNKKIGRQTKSAKVSAKVNVKRPWSEAERSAVHKHLAKFIAERRVPGKLPCMKCIEEEEALNERSWKDVKNFVYNTIVTLNRRSASRKLKF